MSDYYVEIPRRKKNIEFPEMVTITRKSRGRFFFVTCDDDEDNFFEGWLEVNGITYQEQ